MIPVRLDMPRERELQAGVWYSTHASTWYPAHYHEELELKLVLWGTTVYRIGAEEVHLGPGSLLWLAPGQEHALQALSNDLSMWVASFRIPTVRAAERATGLRVLERAQPWGTCVLPSSQVQELSMDHVALARCVEPDQVNAQSAQLLTRALAASRTCASSGQVGQVAPERGQRRSLHAAVARARLILSDESGDVTLPILARRCGLDAARLSRVFRQQMGLSVVEFRNHLGIQRFIARLARAEGQNMLQVALDSGFGSYPQFHRAFRQVTGYAPSEHVRRVRAGIVFPNSPKLCASI